MSGHNCAAFLPLFRRSECTSLNVTCAFCLRFCELWAQVVSCSVPHVYLFIHLMITKVNVLLFLWIWCLHLIWKPDYSHCLCACWGQYPGVFFTLCFLAKSMSFVLSYLSSWGWSQSISCMLLNLAPLAIHQLSNVLITQFTIMFLFFLRWL